MPPNSNTERRKQQNREAQRRHRSAVRKQVEELKAIREDLHDLKNVYYGARSRHLPCSSSRSVRSASNATHMASEAGTPSDLAIEDQANSVDKLNSHLYTPDSDDRYGVIVPAASPSSSMRRREFDSPPIWDYDAIAVTVGHNFISGSTNDQNMTIDPSIPGPAAIESEDGNTIKASMADDQIAFRDEISRPDGHSIDSLKSNVRSPASHNGRRSRSLPTTANKANDGAIRTTALHGAIINGRTEVIQVLLRYGADVNKADQDGNRPLHISAEAGDVETVRLLANHGAQLDVHNMSGETPLQRAATLGNVEMVEVLLQCGADINF